MYSLSVKEWIVAISAHSVTSWGSMFAQCPLLVCPNSPTRRVICPVGQCDKWSRSKLNTSRWWKGFHMFALGCACVHIPAIFATFLYCLRELLRLIRLTNIFRKRTYSVPQKNWACNKPPIYDQRLVLRLDFILRKSKSALLGIHVSTFRTYVI